MRLHIFFHLVVDFDGVFVVENAKNAFIKEVELLEDIHEVEGSTNVFCIFNNELEFFLEFLRMLLSLWIIGLELIGSNRFTLIDKTGAFLW